MPRPATSQWDFGGELFPKEATRRVFSVSELTADIRRVLERSLGQLWVGGEITNCRAQSSGHVYFTLKDAGAQISCVLFRSDSVANRQALQDGQKVILKGELTVYEPRGQYQLHVLAIEPQGVGALQVAFEKLKQKLAAEGLFAPERKRPLPHFPQRIGLVTSPTGAALRDVLHAVQRRQPGLEIIFVPSAVQGAGAAAEIAAAIALLNQWSQRSGRKLDVILLTRGGGSLEDLWAFNEEAVARAIVQSAVPVVSAVGHEIDFTISDFAADVRAATPTAGAEILTEGAFAAARWLEEVQDRMGETVRRYIASEERQLGQLAQRLRASHPRRQLNRRLQLLDDLHGELSRSMRRDLQQRRLAARQLGLRLGRLRPSRQLALRREGLVRQRDRLREQAKNQLHSLRQQCDALGTRLRLLGPEQVLARGYSITQDARTGKVIRATRQTRPGQKLKTRLHIGEVRSAVEKKEEG
ncbi:MAG TPA: exodeoxyribonuclease VII large subunit [Verrucomicrobiae bacterium]|jgi:exodeoxyribonuclease VII large subunit|nr:exodeoxyribonuclease VII large subunit [Verrucomicrobiae bacterium]